MVGVLKTAHLHAIVVLDVPAEAMVLIVTVVIAMVAPGVPVHALVAVVVLVMAAVREDVQVPALDRVEPHVLDAEEHVRLPVMVNAQLVVLEGARNRARMIAVLHVLGHAWDNYMVLRL